MAAMEDGKLEIRVDPPGTVVPGKDFPPALAAALDALLVCPGGENYVEIDRPNSRSIKLDGEFTRAQLGALLEHWNPRPECERGHVLASGSLRVTCWCGARVIG
jgi:hypothetical protein